GDGCGGVDRDREWDEVAVRSVCADLAACRAAEYGRRLLPRGLHHLPDRGGGVVEDQPVECGGGDPGHPGGGAGEAGDSVAPVRDADVGRWGVADAEWARPGQGDSLL